MAGVIKVIVAVVWATVVVTFTGTKGCLASVRKIVVETKSNIIIVSNVNQQMISIFVMLKLITYLW